MGQYITLERSHKNFQAYLMGTFSNDQRAIPVRSFHPSENHERITFKVVLKKKLKRPHWLVLMSRLLRLELLGLTIMPLLVSGAYLWSQNISANWWMAALVLVIASCFHGAVFALNDFQDHVRGVDRIGVNSGSRVIQNGWLSAKEVRRLALGFMAVGAVLSLPVILAQPLPALVVALGVALSVLGYSFSGQGLRSWGLGPTVISLALGPLLTVGFGVVATGLWHYQLASLGLYFGFLAALYLQLRHFERIMADDQAQVKTLMSRLGFDRSKLFISWQIPLVLILYFALVTYCQLSPQFYWGGLPLSIVCLQLYLRLTQCQSPVSSALEGLKDEGVKLHLVAGFVLFLLMLPQ